MKILLTNITTFDTDGLIQPNIEVTADLARPDLVIEEIIKEKGITFVLNAIGDAEIRKIRDEAIQGYIKRCNEYQAA